MTNRNIILALFCFVPLSFINGQTYMSEGFESGELPENWTQEYVTGIQDWRYRNGGHSPNDDNWSLPADMNDITRNPPSAYAGTYNAIFFQQGYDNEKTKLITPPIDLLGGVNVELSFYLCQIPWTFAGSTSWDILRIFYKSSAEDEWTLLHEFIDPIYDWEQKKLLLPDVSDTYYLAFEGHSRWGYGTCIDEILIEETGSTPMYLANIDFQQPFTNYIPSGSYNVPLMRTDFRVLGNTGAVLLEEMEFTSLNDDDSDILPNSLKLYATNDQTFTTNNQVGSASSFTGGKVTFTGLNDTIARGSSYIWLAADVAPDATHENVLDIMVTANSVTANGATYPSGDADPPGERLIYETRYSVDFEGAHNWILTGEFEVATPNGMPGETGNPNPSNAYSGLFSLGTDLTGQGAHPYSYEPGLSQATSYLATSPAIDALYYKNLSLFFKRYLNVGANDKSNIEVSTDNGATWNVLWTNVATVTDFSWSEELLSIPNAYSKSEEFKVRFKLGPTNSTLNYTGWNLDEIFVTGEFISKDVGVTGWVYPISGSGHTATDTVTLKIFNFGGADITDPVPVAFSIDGGNKWTVDYMQQDIPVGSEVTFTFPKTIDLSVPGLYPNVLAKTFIPGDQDLTNDQFATQLFIIPTLVPPHQEDFESNDGFWKATGNLWEYGSPAGTVINSASSGSSSWMTKLFKHYGDQLIEGNEVLFEDDFEIDRGWTFEGEFERGIPNSEYVPYFAYYTGLYCIGTDFSGTGPNPYFYENNIPAGTGTAFTATTPAIDVSDFVNLEINFARMIALQEGDSVKIEVSPDNGATWNTIWKNTEGAISDFDWNFYGYGIPDNLTNTSNLKIRFSLFYTSAAGPVAEGFNIDDFRLTGDRVTFIPQYLDSPSYNLSGISKPVFEARIWSDTESGVDGATMFYSLDEGETWEHVANPSGFDTYWNWYTGKPVSSLGLNGWSGQSGGWVTVRHTLPSAVSNKDNVQLRFEFLSDKSNNEYDGIALDDVRVIDAPIDVGIMDILSPSTTCELSGNEKFRIRIKNFGIKNINLGDEIQVSYSIDKDGVIQTAEETVILPQSIIIGSTLDLNLNTPFDLSESGTYATTISIIEDEPNFYNATSNNSFTKLISVNKPSVDLGPDISTVQPDTVILRAYSGEPGNSYLWQDGSTDSVFHVTTDGTYSVTVSNGVPCYAYDTIQVLQLVVDVGVSTLYGPDSDCELGSQVPIQIAIDNFGTDTVAIGDTIFVYAEINQTIVFQETLKLTSRFFPGQRIDFTYSGNYDFSSPGVYNMKLYTRLKGDVTYLTDTLFYPLEVYGYPDIDLGPDTIVNAAEYVLSPGAGYFEYLWQDGSNLETFTINQGGSGTYSVTVSDEHQCSSQDIVNVTLNVEDVVLEEILSPGSGCEVSTSITVAARIRNAGNDPILSGESIIMGYTFNGGPEVEETLVLSSDFQPQTTLDYTFSVSESVSAGQWYDFVVYVDFEKDTKLWNDTLNKTVGVYQPPDIDLGDPYQVISATVHTLDAGPGFVSYRWQDGSTNQTFTIDKPGIGIYGVTVVDVNGCEHYEEVQILMIVPDVGVLQLVSPVTSCALGSNEKLQVAIKNFGAETIAPTENIKVAYSINSSNAIVESVDLGSGFEGGSVIYHTFSAIEDFSTPGRYNVVTYTEYSADLIPTNDIIIEIVDVLGNPTVDIGQGEDTISIDGPTTLSVETGYLLYEWQDGSTNPDFTITTPSAEMYSVKVTGGNGCVTEDSVFVIYDIPDIKLVEIATPVSSCELSAATTVSLEIMNEGFFRISTSENITITYSVNGGSSKIEVVNLKTPLLPGETAIVPFSSKYNFSDVGDYSISANIIYQKDTDPADNFGSSTISVLGTPVVQIGDGSDTIRTELPYTLIADAGFTSYLWQDEFVGNSYEVTSYGWYKVMVTDENDCMGFDSVLVDFPISIETLKFESGKINIYPNPARDYIHAVLTTEDNLNVTYELYNMLNAMVYKEEVEHKQVSDTKIDLQKMVPGTYYLHIVAGKESLVYLVVVQ